MSRKINPETWVASSAFVLGMILLPLVWRGCGSCNQKTVKQPVEEVRKPDTTVNGQVNNQIIYINGNCNTVNVNNGHHNIINNSGNTCGSKRVCDNGIKPNTKKPCTKKPCSKKPDPKPAKCDTVFVCDTTHQQPKPAANDGTIVIDFNQITIDCRGNMDTCAKRAYYRAVGETAVLDSIVTVRQK